MFRSMATRLAALNGMLMAPIPLGEGAKSILVTPVDEPSVFREYR